MNYKIICMRCAEEIKETIEGHKICKSCYDISYEEWLMRYENEMLGKHFRERINNEREKK